MNYLSVFNNESHPAFLAYFSSTIEGLKLVMGVIIIVLLVLQQRRLNALEKKVEKIITG